MGKAFSGITVTMPIEEYEKLKKELKEAESKSIYKYVKRNYADIEANQYEDVLNVEGIKTEINSDGIYKIN